MPIESHDGGLTITGNAIHRFQLTTVAKALELGLKGIKVNRAYTPAAMCAVVTRFTGRDYARGKKGMQAALKDARELLEGGTADSITPVVP